MSTQNNATTVSRRRVGTLATLAFATALTSACGGGGGGSAAPSGPFDVVPDPVVTPPIDTTPDPVDPPIDVTPQPDPVVVTDPLNPDFIKGEVHYDYTDPDLYNFSDGRVTITLDADEFTQSGMAYNLEFREDAFVTITGLLAENIDINVKGSETFIVGESNDKYIIEKDIPDNVTIEAFDAENIWVFRLADENFTVKGNHTVTVNTAGTGFLFEGDTVRSLDDLGFDGDINAQTKIFVSGDDQGFNNLTAKDIQIDGDLGFVTIANADGGDVTLTGDATLGSIINAPEGRTVIFEDVAESARITTKEGIVGGIFDRGASINASECFNFEGGFTGEGETPEIERCEGPEYQVNALQFNGGMQ